MSFVHPLLLIGLVAASIPIVIHLLNKRRFRIVDWAAMEFLLASMRKNNRRLRIEEILLLVLRTLLVALLAFAVARPILGSGGLAAFLSGAKRTAVILFDTSFSMGYRQGTATSLSRGKEAAGAILSELRGGDSVVLTSFTRSPHALIKEPTTDLRLAAAEIDRLVLSHDSSDALAALESVYETARACDAPTKTVYLISDLHAISFNQERLKDPGLVRKLEELSRVAELVIVDVGFEEPGNLAVMPPKIDSTILTPGSTFTVSGIVKNYTPSPQTLRVDLLLDGSTQGTTTVKPDPQGEASVSFIANVSTEGTHVVELKLEPDNLDLDNRSYLSVLVRQGFKVLLVDGAPGKEKADSAAFYVKEALMPEGGESLAAAKPEVVSVEALPSIVFDEFDVVVFANVARLPSEVVQQVASYTERGGSLLFFLGDNVDRTFYNESLRALTGCELREVKTETAGLTVKDYSHPAFRLFKGLRLTRIESATFKSRWLVKVDADKDTGSSAGTVLMEFGSGEAALTERRCGDGKVFLFTSSADTRWSDFPTRPAYPAFVNELVRYAARDPSRSLNIAVGDNLVARLPAEFFARKIDLDMPGGQQTSLSPVPEGNWVICRQPSVPYAGVYTIRAEGLERQYVANLPADESNLQRISVGELRKVLSGVEFKYRRGYRAEAGPTTGESPSEITRLLLYGLIVIALGELFLAQRFTR